LATFLAHMHQLRFGQQFEMMADCGLVDPSAQRLHHVVHAQPLAAEDFHDLLARFVGDGFGKGEDSGIDRHGDIILINVDTSNWIEVCMKFVAFDERPTDAALKVDEVVLEIALF
jgi:hypothetical protein